MQYNLSMNISLPNLARLHLLALSILLLPASADDALDFSPLDEPADPLLEFEITEQVIDSRMVEALSELDQAIRIREREYEELNQRLREEDLNEIERGQLLEELQSVSDELRVQKQRFLEGATGIDISLFQEAEAEAFSWEQKLGDLLRPILGEFERATERTRRIANVRTNLEEAREKEHSARRAVAHLEDILSQTDSEELSLRLRELIRVWENRARFFASQARSAELQLESLTSEETSILDESTTYIRGFLQQRGLNLILGFGSALLVFLSVRFIIYLARRARGNRNPTKLGSRIFVLVANLVSVVGAVLVLLVVFSATGDLFLFGLVVLFLLGAAWAGIKVIPQFIESLKLILNVGMVKEGERLIYDDISWNVQSLGFSSKLTNHRLDEGIQIIPVRDLVGLHSRPWCEDELEFPTERGDWVELSNEKVGKIVRQNPGHVVLEEWGGAHTTYPTVEFLSLHPKNLSHGFRIVNRFGIDYNHQKECLDEVPTYFKQTVQEGLEKRLGKENMKRLEVYFAEAGASSLDYEVHLTLEGSAAEHYEVCRFQIQQLLVLACNQKGWGIPFQQITIHQAKEA